MRRGKLRNGSGTIASGGTAQQVFAACESRTYLLVQNLSDTVMYLDFGTDAAAAAGSILLAANGGSYECPADFCPTQRVSIFCATTGKAFTAKEA